MKETRDWFYGNRDGKKVGPIAEGELLQLLSDGELPVAAKMWREDVSSTPNPPSEDYGREVPETEHSFPTAPSGKQSTIPAWLYWIIFILFIFVTLFVEL